MARAHCFTTSWSEGAVLLLRALDAHHMYVVRVSRRSCLHLRHIAAADASVCCRTVGSIFAELGVAWSCTGALCGVLMQTVHQGKHMLVCATRCYTST